MTPARAMAAARRRSSRASDAGAGHHVRRVLALTLSGCSWQHVFGLGWPKGITPEAHANRDLWVGSVIAALVVGVIVWGLMFWTGAFHRKKKGEDRDCPASSATTCRWNWF